MKSSLHQRVCNTFCIKTDSTVLKCWRSVNLSKRNFYVWPKYLWVRRGWRTQPTSKTDEIVDKTVFMDYNGVVHHEFLPKDQTINKQYYLGVMRRLREAIRQKRLDLWKSMNEQCHHYPQLFDQERKEYHPTATEFDWFGSLRLFPVQSTQLIALGNAF